MYVRMLASGNNLPDLEMKSGEEDTNADISLDDVTLDSTLDYYENEGTADICLDDTIREEHLDDSEVTFPTLTVAEKSIYADMLTAAGPTPDIIVRD